MLVSIPAPPSMFLYGQARFSTEINQFCTDADKLPPSLHPSYFSAVTRPVPIVSCYIPSLAIGCPFRASVHSWDTPIATPATASMAHNESMAAFEAKVLVDGTYVAYDMTFLGPWCTMRWLMDDDSGAVFDRGDEWPQSIRE